MNIDLKELNFKDSIDINEEVYKDEFLDKRIIALKNAKVTGKITKNSNNDINLNVNFYGDMIINDSISLEEVPYKFNIRIDENLDEIQDNYLDCYENSKNILDLKAILWQNIVLEVPISYTVVGNPELKGDGWELVNNDSKTVDEIDPRLKKLEDLLKGDD